MVCENVSANLVEPHFTLPPESIEVMPGGSGNLTCFAVGSPMPHVRWRNGTKEMMAEDSFDSAPIGRGDLVLTNVLHSANFTCVAYSDIGSVEATAEVKVKGTRCIF
jgi:receptor-type tyrosine-protein phosphatase F